LARPAFKSEKRKKEVQRLKKQEEKRQKRLNKAVGDQPGGEVMEIVEGEEGVTTEQTETPAEPTAPAQQ
jgi:hypothetical protein